MSKSVAGPLRDGTAAFPWPEPRRGQVDEQVYEGLVYSCPPGSRPLPLDLRLPRRVAAEQPLPLVMWVHGGDWVHGSRRRLPPNIERHWLIERLLLAGFAVALVDYRLSGEAPFPAPVADVRAALRWLRGHADEFGLDGGRVGLWGESAGAHLACLAATCDLGLGDHGEEAEYLDQSERVQAVVDWYGPADLAAQRMAGDAQLVPTMAGSEWDDAGASPLNYARSGLPPLLVAHGRDDAVVPAGQSRSYAAALACAGVDVEYVETDGGHVFEGADVVPEMIDRSIDFLCRRLRVSPPPLPEAAGARPRQYPVESSQTAIDGPGGRLTLRIQRPAVPADAVVVYLPDDERDEGARLAASTPATVVRVDRFPGALDDVVAGVTWAAKHLDELGGERLVLAGTGAGASLAAAAAAHCRDAGIDVAAQVLLYPVTGYPQRLAGLPYTLLGVGALDPLLDENLAFAYRLRQAEVPVSLHVFPALGHGFFGQPDPSRAADRASEQMCRALNEFVWEAAA